ncbi:Uncharacterised protein r2_g390 [Pycnogonum litorale]
MQIKSDCRRRGTMPEKKTINSTLSSHNSMSHDLFGGDCPLLCPGVEGSATAQLKTTPANWYIKDTSGDGRAVNNAPERDISEWFVLEVGLCQRSALSLGQADGRSYESARTSAVAICTQQTISRRNDVIV